MLVIAHRGASGHAPENTLAAFKRAIALGATFIETDLQLSRDTRFVAIHDDTVNRTTNGHGKVHDLTLNELRRLDEAIPLRERLRPLQRRVLARPATGLGEQKQLCSEIQLQAFLDVPYIPPGAFNFGSSGEIVGV